MTTKVEQVLPADSIEFAKTLMRVKGVHHLVVVERREVKGIVTATQLAEAGAKDSVTVADVMTRHLATASPDLPVRKAANLIRGSVVGALPVLDRGKLVGIVTVSDLLELIGRGGARPVEKATRWTLRNRGVLPAQARVGKR
jgi:CBS domain-containing protein